MVEETIETFEEQFSWIKDDDRILAVLLFGSVVKDEEHCRSDIDISIVVPGSSHYYYDCEGVSNRDVKSSDVLMKAFRNTDVITNEFDVHIFEDLPLRVKMDIIEDHEIIYTADKFGMYEYFYNYRKIWEDQKHRNTMSKEELLAGL